MDIFQIFQQVDDDDVSAKMDGLVIDTGAPQIDLRPLQAEIAKIDISEYFDIHDWNINSTGYENKATIRQSLVEQFKHLTDITDYLTDFPIWASSVSMPFLGTVAFIPKDSDEWNYLW